MEGEKGEWGFKAHKQIVKALFRERRPGELLEAYQGMLGYLAGAVSRNDAEKKINSLLDYVSGPKQREGAEARVGGDGGEEGPTVLEALYGATLEALGGGRNERLWFKASLKLCSLLLQQRAWGRLERTLDALRAHCTLADGSADSRKGTQLLEVLSVEIQMRTELRQAKALKGLYQRALRVKGAIPHPKVLGVIRECGGKMHMGARAWGAAATDFFEAFRSFDEAGAARRVKCLKYLVLAQMLAASDVDPFDAPETKPYKNDPEVLAMTSLIGAYQRGDAQEFRAVLERNEGAIMGDPFIRVHMESLLRQVREQVLLKLLRPYRSMRVAFAARELGVAPEEVEAMLVTLILDGKVQGRLDQVEGTLELECTDSGAQHLHEAVLGLSRSLGSFHGAVARKAVTANL